MSLMSLTAVELGKKIRAKEVSVTEAVKEALAQAEAKENSVHAYVSLNPDYALERAEQVQKQIADGTLTGPLAGVPVAIKDNMCTKGIKTTCSSRILENFVPPYSAQAVENLERAGAVIIGKTNMDEFAMGSTTETSAFGVTRNPWNLEHVPGGSSGGSCAAVAANEVFAALGSDTGGSIRQPSAYCGVAGMKPTYGTVSRYGLIAYASSLDQIGPVGKNVADCAALLEIISGPDRRDSTCVAGESLDFSGLWEEYKISPEAVAAGLRGMRVGVPEEYFTGGIDPQIRDAVLKAADTMKAGGAIVETFSLGMTQYMIPAYYIIACAQASSNLARFDGVKYGYRTEGAGDLHDMYKKTRAQGCGWEVKKRILLGSFVLSSGYYDAYYIKALKANRLIKEAFDRAFEKYDLILAPAAPSAAPKLGTSLTDPLKMYLSDIYTVAVNLAGLPAMSMPCGQTGSLPVGLQLIGQRFKDDIVVRGAAAYEVLRGNWMASEAPSEEVKEAL